MLDVLLFTRSHHYYVVTEVPAYLIDFMFLRGTDLAQTICRTTVWRPEGKKVIMSCCS
jgi:hypothetical protein